MVEIASIYNTLLVGSIVAIIEEIIFLLTLYRDEAGWHFNFPTLEDFENLRPLISLDKVALIIFSISIIGIPLLSLIFYDPIANYAKGLHYNFLLLISALIGVFFVILRCVVGDEWDWKQAMLILGFCLPLLLLIYFNYLILP